MLYALLTWVRAVARTSKDEDKDRRVPTAAVSQEERESWRDWSHTHHMKRISA